MTETPYAQLEKPSEEEEPTGWKAKLIIASVIIGGIMSFVSLILAITAYAQIAGFTSDYDSTVQSWESQPLSDIVFVSGPCPGGYSTVKSRWPGTSTACNCVGVYNATTTDSSSCTSDQIYKGCYNQYGLDPVDLDLFFGISLCVLRQGPSALQRVPDPTPPDFSCPSGTAICGAGFNGAVCYPNNLPCPITDLGFTTFNVSNVNADFSMQVPNNNYWFYYKRGGYLNGSIFDVAVRSPSSFPVTGLPLTNINFQPADPCTLSGCGYGGRSSEYSTMEKNFNYSQDEDGYMLRSFPCDGGCTIPDVSNSVSPTGRDLRYFRTFNISERTLYTRYTNTNPTYIPYEYITSKDTFIWYLSVRSEIQWAADCPQTRSQVQDKQSTVDGVRSAQIALLLFTILAFLFLSLFFPCVQYCRKEDYPKVKPYEKPCKYILKVVALVCTLVTMILALGTLNFWASINDYDKGESGLLLDGTNSCSDPLTDETFSTLGDTFYSLSNKNIINTASMSITTVFDVVKDLLQRIF